MFQQFIPHQVQQAGLSTSRLRPPAQGGRNRASVAAHVPLIRIGGLGTVPIPSLQGANLTPGESSLLLRLRKRSPYARSGPPRGREGGSLPTSFLSLPYPFRNRFATPATSGASGAEVHGGVCAQSSSLQYCVLLFGPWSPRTFTTKSQENCIKSTLN